LHQGRDISMQRLHTTPPESAKIDAAQLCFGKGDVIFHQGDAAQYWYEVISGTVRSCRFLLDGRRQLTGFHFVGDVFGVEQGRYPATADAVCDTVLRRMHHLAIPQTPSTDPAPDYLQRAYRNAMQFIYLMGHRTAVERVAAFLLIIAQRPRMAIPPQKNGGDLIDLPLIDLPMSRVDIADHLGLTIHTVSRTISLLVREHIIATRGRQQIRILDRAMLARRAGEADDLATPFQHPSLFSFSEYAA
jgi:CRP-like cAMP-binding protein